MSFKCKIGLHSWNGCKCSECGKIRDEQHDWSNDCVNCCTCGKVRYLQNHSWSNDCEKCSICGKTRKDQHDWSKDDTKCSKCGKTRENKYDWANDSEKFSSNSQSKTKTDLTPNSNNTSSATIPTNTQTAIYKEKSEQTANIERIISDLKEIAISMKTLSTFDNQYMILANKQVERAKSSVYIDFQMIEPFLKSIDFETRAYAAFIIKVKFLNSKAIPIPSSTVSLLGLLLHDSNGRVSDTALDTLFEISRYTDIDIIMEDIVSILPLSDIDEMINVIEILSNSHQKSTIVVSTLQKLSANDKSEIAYSARSALKKLGITINKEDENPIVQKPTNYNDEDDLNINIVPIPLEKKLKQSAQEQLSMEPNMIFVEGAYYDMGRDFGSNNRPVHQVMVNSFYIDKYQTTVKEYRLFCKMTGKIMPIPPYWGWNDDHPIVNITWFEADEYAKWKGKRLPTEAEWEFASRGGIKSKNYECSGSAIREEVAWYKENSGNVTHPVGLKLENELGLHDMNGNVWEYCFDWYLWNYYAQSQSDNPTGPLEGNGRSIRGGGCADDFSWVDSFTRSHKEPNESGIYTGFRCVKNY